ncbi:MAG: hypothetical protein ABTQ29_02105 [Siculibacillus sp.]
MSNEKSQSQTHTQQSQAATDSLDAQYKSIGISAVSAAAAAMKSPKVKKPGEQMS